MRRTLILSMLLLGLLAVSLTACGGAGSSVTGPTLMEETSDIP